MRRDSIFYKIFQQTPASLFELLPNPPINAQDYRFDSVAVKEPKFEIDGVFLPPNTGTPGVVYFCEVQFQKDEQLYERVFGESFLYFYRNRARYCDWQAVVIYPSRSLEQSELHPYRALLSSEQVHRIYLNELGAIRHLPIGIALMILTTLNRQQTPIEARHLLTRTEQETTTEAESRAIIEVVTTIMVYQFSELSRVEVEAMLNMRLEETRVYQEAKNEGREEGREQGREQGREEGRLVEAANLVLRLLTRRLGQKLSPEMKTTIAALPLPLLEELIEAVLDFGTLADLETWLTEH
ncbi:MAG: Rpn family recombination-promoting nuclease/putative transposase [Timaviella obliquedivisa GSE-PSE-MK23-08B]|jgi:predicted transposase/invertase (TIGR01784 family)|nr:Rpn family recombination-promoting nuclease/putative transposase [Timaviella obliquedivisa GSE-PSE-MK23-08B]